MKNNYDKILKKLSTDDFFRKSSRIIIELYKAEHFSKLNIIHSRIFSEKGRIESGQSTADNRSRSKKIFYSLIKIYHPDSFKFHLSRFNTAADENDSDVLDFYSRLTMFDPDIHQTGKEDNINYEEYYVYEEDEYRTWIFNEGEDAEYGIAEIISQIYLGNSGKTFEPVDLSQIEGELILSSLNIKDLDGLQFCTSVTNLDLSHNSIENIFEINKLTQLEELDLSSNEIYDIDMLSGLDNLEILYLDFNQIEDFSVLLELKELKFVSLTNNLIENQETIYKLKDNGVVVID